MAKRIKRWARKLKLLTWTLYYACRDPATPWYARAWAAIVVAYAFSPVDLIPDFIPVLGYLDDLILIPLGIALAVRLIPAEVIARCTKLAEERIARPRPRNWIAGAIVIAVWASLLFLVVRLVYAYIRR